MIYLMRHGEIETGGEKSFIGQTDLPLSEKGEARARCWRDRLGSVTFHRVCCSDLSRTRHTARIIAGNRLPIQEVPELREIRLGEWDGVPISRVKTLFPEAWKKRGEAIATYRPPGGESFLDLRERVLPAFEAAAGTGEENVLVVAHAGVNRVLLCHILGMPLDALFRLGQDYGCLNLIRCRKGFRVEAINRM